MKIYYLKITLILIIYISPHKTKAHENITINPENCQMALLSHESALSTFFEAIREDDTDKLLIFKNMNWDLHTSYQNGRILLHYAAILGKPQAIDILVAELGIDVNIQETETGRTALHHAVLNTNPSSRLDTIYTLITLGAHIYTLDNEGYRASQYVEDNEKPYHFKYSEEQKKKTVELTLPPYNIIRRELAKLLQISYYTLPNWVNQHRKNHNLKTRRQVFQEKKTRVIHLITIENMTQRQAAEEVGVPETTASGWVNQHRKNHNLKTQRQVFQEKKTRVIHLISTENMTQRQAAEEVGVSEGTVSDWVNQYEKEHDIKIQRQDSQEKKTRVIHLISTENMTQRQAAEEVGVPESTVSYWVNQYEEEHGIKIRQEKKTRVIHLITIENMTQRQAAEEVGVPESTASGWMRQYREEHNMPTQQHASQEDKNKAIEMSNAGINAVEIARALGKPPSTVRHWVHPYRNKHKRYSQQFRDHAAKMFIENGIDKEAIINILNIDISIRILNIWIDHYKERCQTEEIEINCQEINELQDDDSEEDTFDQLNHFYSEMDAAMVIVKRNLNLKDTIEIANENHLDLELLKLYVRNYRYR